MTELCIQIQPHRNPNLDVAAVRDRCEMLASSETVIERFAVVEGVDDVTYMNLMFEARSVVALWTLVQDRLYADETLGPPLLRSSMAMCQGNHGWDDYLLLHHFDNTLKLDSLTDD